MPHGGLDPVTQAFLADNSDTIAKIREMRAEYAPLAAMLRERVKIDVDTSGALAGIGEVRAALQGLPDSRTIKVDVDTSAAMAKVAALRAAVGDLGDSGGIRAAIGGPGGGAGDAAAMIRELRDISASMDQVTTSLGNMEGHLTSIRRDVADSSADLMMQTQALRDNASAHDLVAAATGRSASATRDAAAIARDSASANYSNAMAGYLTAKAAAGAFGGDGGGGGGGAFLGAAAGAGGRGLAATIFGGATATLAGAHMVTMLTMEVASQVIPAAVAAGAAAAVGTQGAVAAYQRGAGIYAAGESLGGAYGQTPGQLFGMGSGFQVAQNQATGGVYGIIGSLMRMAGQGSAAGGLIGPGGMGVQTVAMIDRGLANMVGSGRAAQVGQAVGGGTAALQTIGDIFGNLGDSLLNLAPVLPGMGGMLFGGLKTGTGLLRSFTGLAGKGGLMPLLFGGGLAAEAGFRWGGPILGGGKLPWFLGGGQFKGMAGLAERLGLGKTAAGANVALDAQRASMLAAGLGEGDLAAIGMGAAGSAEGTGLAGMLAGGVAGLPIAAIAALAASGAYGISQGQFGTPAAGAMGGYMRSINATFGAGSLTPIKQALFQAGQTQGHLPGISYDTVAGQQVPVGETMGQLRRQGYSPQEAMAKIQGEYSSNLQNVATQLGQMAAAGPAAQKALSDLGIKGGSLAQAYDYLTMAMISPKDVGAGGKLDKTALSQLASFVGTYSLMSAGPGSAAFTAAHVRALQPSVSALASAGGADYVMTSPQVKALTQVNQALDSMTQMMTGGAANASALTGLSQAIQAAGTASAFGKALGQGPFTAGGAAAWQAFTNPQTGIIPASQQNMDQLRTYMTIGGLTGPQAGQLGAFELQKSVLPYAGSSPMALAMLQQQAMQAGVPGVAMGQSYAHTRAAINAHAGTMAQANQLMTRGTQAAANIPGVADFLNPQANVNPLQSALYAQMAQQALAAAQHPTKANVGALQSSLGMAGVGAGQMKIGIDAILKNLHVPSNLIAKINAEITPPKVPPVKGVVTYANNIPAPKPQHGYGVIHYANSVPPVPHPVGYGTIIYSASIVGLGSVRTVSAAGSVGSLGGHTGQSGFKVPGYGGGDTFPAMLEGGEAVVPKHLVPSIAPFLSANKVPGFAGGGIAGVTVPDVTGLGMPMRIAMQSGFNQMTSGLNTYLGGLMQPYGGGGGSYRQGLPISQAVPVKIVGTSGGTGFSIPGHVPLPPAASKVIDSFEETFKKMKSPWGKLSSDILSEMLAGIKDGKKETAAMAKALVSQVSSEIGSLKGMGSPWAGIAAQIMSGMLDGIKGNKGETAAMAQAMFGQVTKEVNYMRTVAGATNAISQWGNFGGGLATPTTTAQGQNYQYYTDQQAIAGGGTVSVQQNMGDYLQAMKSFQGDIGKLSKGGINKQMLQQIIGAGPLQGDQEAQSILGGGGGVKGANQLWNQINAMSKSLGITAGQDVYGFGGVGGPGGKNVKASAQVTGAGAVHALQSAINSLHGKTVTINVNVVEGGGGGSGGTGSKLNKTEIKAVTGAVQAQLLRQAKQNRRTGIQLPGYGS